MLTNLPVDILDRFAAVGPVWLAIRGIRARPTWSDLLANYSVTVMESIGITRQDLIWRQKAIVRAGRTDLLQYLRAEQVSFARRRRLAHGIMRTILPPDENQLATWAVRWEQWPILELVAVKADLRATAATIIITHGVNSPGLATLTPFCGEDDAAEISRYIRAATIPADELSDETISHMEISSCYCRNILLCRTDLSTEVLARIHGAATVMFMRGQIDLLNSFMRRGWTLEWCLGMPKHIPPESIAWGREHDPGMLVHMLILLEDFDTLKQLCADETILATLINIARCGTHTGCGNAPVLLWLEQRGHIDMDQHTMHWMHARVDEARAIWPASRPIDAITARRITATVLESPRLLTVQYATQIVPREIFAEVYAAKGAACMEVAGFLSAAGYGYHRINVDRDYPLPVRQFDRENMEEENALVIGDKPRKSNKCAIL
jgi:hypothetical protein